MGKDNGDRQAIADGVCADLWTLGHTVKAASPEALYPIMTGAIARLHDDEQSAVQDLLEQWLVNELERMPGRHWEPVDLGHVVERRLGAGHHLLVLRLLFRITVNGRDEVATLLDEIATVPVDVETSVLENLRREGSLDRGAIWATALSLLQLLVRLPDLPPLGSGSRPGRSPTDRPDGPTGLVDRKLLDRVRGLLSKAESTTFPEEADALTAKAQELMARHAIDQAMVEGDAGSSGAPGGGPSSRRLWIDNPYADGKSLLLNNVARANRCQSVYFRALGFMTVIGYPADLDAVDLLFTSLLVQADTAIRQAGSHVDRSGRSRTRSFRSSFWVAFGSRIGQRLEEAVAATVHDAEAEHGAELLPVLASRSVRVEALTEELFPEATARGVVASNHAGWQAGTQAADRADIGIRRPIQSTT
jgi:hypothetical protein